MDIGSAMMQGRRPKMEDKHCIIPDLHKTAKALGAGGLDHLSEPSGLYCVFDGHCVRTTLETRGEDAKLHSKRVGKMRNYTRNEWRRCETTLETSGENVKLHSERV